MRYQRQISFEHFGKSSQEHLSKKRALIIGCGALGGSIAEILARAGIGSLRIVDPDVIELGNLHRQFLFDEEDAANSRPKIESARNRLLRINSGLELETICEKFTEKNAWKLSESIDVILDGCDNFETRYLMNSTALERSVPFVHGGILGAGGQMTVLNPGIGPCFACVFGELMETHNSESGPDGIAAHGILSPIVQIIASLEAMEAIKILSGNSESVRKIMYRIDLWPIKFREFELPPRNPNCSVCGCG